MTKKQRDRMMALVSVSESVEVGADVMTDLLTALDAAEARAERLDAMTKPPGQDREEFIRELLKRIDAAEARAEKAEAELRREEKLAEALTKAGEVLVARAERLEKAVKLVSSARLAQPAPGGEGE